MGTDSDGSRDSDRLPGERGAESPDAPDPPAEPVDARTAEASAIAEQPDEPQPEEPQLTDLTADGQSVEESTAASRADEPPARRAFRVAGHLGRRLPGWLVRGALRVAFPLAAVAAIMHLFPYQTTAAGLHLRVQGTILTNPGVSADTTIGNWQFPHVDGLPVGVHIIPENVDLLRLATAANANSQGFTDTLRHDIDRQIPHIAWWLIGETVLGIVVGLAVAAGCNMAFRYLRGQVRAQRKWRRTAVQFGGAVLVVAGVAGYGVASYNPHWDKQSRLTGTLGAVQLVPDQLQRFYNHQSKVYDVITAISGIQAELQQQIGDQSIPATSYNIMFISDMHLAATYPLVEQYADSFDVKLIVNTGDETEFGSPYELTDTYLAQIRAITATIPMIWIAGNHDSPATVETMRSIPGVTVLGGKNERLDATYQVSAQEVAADGLEIAGVPDPRVYDSAGAAGSEDTAQTDPLERSSVDAALSGVSRSERFDIFATHEPVAAKELVKDLPGQIRQTNAGHTHAQNSSATVQQGSDSPINLVEGSTGAGGLDSINSNPVPVEFSIESVAADCQFTKVVRFQLQGSVAAGPVTASDYGQNVSATTIYLRPQQIDTDRFCSTELGVSSVEDLGPSS
jgi:predicted MPP superfamily phosphohydrolase